MDRAGGGAVGAVHHRTAIAGLLAVGAYVAAPAALWLAISLRVPHGDARWPHIVPGAVLYGVGMTGIGVFNVLVLGRMIESKPTTYGALGVAATLLLGLFLVGRVVVGSAVLDATLHDRRRRLADV